MAFRLLSFFFLFLSVFPAWSDVPSGQPGIPYITYFIPETADHHFMARELARLDDPRILSPWTSVVEVADFTGLDMVRLDLVSGRLSRDDPRWTPFLRDVSRIFETYSGGRKGYKLLIPEQTVMDHRSGGVLREILDHSGGLEATGTPFTALPAGPWTWVLSLGVYAAWAALWILRRGRFKSFPLVLFAAGGLTAAFQMILLLPLMAFTAAVLTGRDRIRAYHERRSGKNPEDLSPTLFQGGVLAAGLITLGLVGSFPPEWWTGTLLLALAAGLAGMGYWRLRSLEARKQEHLYFSPVGMKLPGRRNSGRAGTLALGILPFLALLIQAPGSPPGDLKVTAGLPDLVFSPETELARVKEESAGIPGPASWLAHRIYQETFVFGLWKGDLSRPQAPVTLPAYSRSGGRITETRETVLHLEDRWLRDVAAALPSHHSLRAAATADIQAGQTFPLPGLATLGLLYFFLLLVRWFPASGLQKDRIAFEARRDSLA